MSTIPIAVPDRTVCERESPSNRNWLLPVFAFLAALLVPFYAAASGNPPVTTAAQTYQMERDRCMNAPATDDRTACLKSAGAAYEEAKRGTLDVAPHPYEDNRLSRCEPLPADDRRYCVMRMEGAGTSSGSVDGGGILYELVTREPAPEPTDAH